jgi:short-subunit dehydrogenase/FAD/FMN-containing dehydrogenase
MTKLYSWGRYPNKPQTPHPCYWRQDILPSFEQYTSLLPYGNGLSYGDSCLATSGHVLHTRTLDRFIHADWLNGIITAEPGVTLEEILSLAIPQGWFIPVTPGTKYVTLGGAVANDVHGKNHHVRGTFGCHVQRFGLVRSDETHHICSTAQNPELFSATIGGLGLTGVITWATLQLLPIKSSRVDAITMRFNSLDEFFALSAEHDPHHEYSVAWIDCLAKAGRGILTLGDHASTGELIVNHNAAYSMPITPPISLINNVSLRLFNTLYYHACSAGKVKKSLDYNPFFYPLDRLLKWNRIYGPHGFQQYQCVIPNHTAQDATRELLKIISVSSNGSFLAVLKRCGNIASPGLLSFPLPGISLALDFPQRDALNTIVSHIGYHCATSRRAVVSCKRCTYVGRRFSTFLSSMGTIRKAARSSLMFSFLETSNLMKKILVIGATSAIATACSRLWATEKSDFFLVGRNSDKLQQVANDLSARGAHAVSVDTLDLNHTDAHEKMLDACFLVLGTVDIVLIAHGTLPDQKTCEQNTLIALKEFSSNGLSVIALLTTLANRMAHQKSGTIAVISSVAGDRGRPSNYLYGSAKAAVTTFCEGLRARLFKVGVHVLTIKPGFVDTPMTAGLPLPQALVVTPEHVAKDIVKAIQNKANTLYTPWFWRWIMLIIRAIPPSIFKKLGL